MNVSDLNSPGGTEIVSFDEATRLLKELLRDAGEAGMAKDELEKALEQFEDWHISAGFLHLWRQHRIRLGWNTEDQDLKIIGADCGEPR